MKKETGKRIAKVRKKAGDSQEKAAEKLGIGRSALGNYESGVSSMPDDIRDNFVKIYDISHDYLMGNAVHEPSVHYGTPKSMLELIELLEDGPVKNQIRSKAIKMISDDSEQKEKIIKLHEYKDDLLKILRDAGYDVSIDH